jgi:hypothetical protein
MPGVSKIRGAGGDLNDGNPILALPDDYSSFLDLLGAQQDSQPDQEGLSALGERTSHQREGSCESLKSLPNCSHLQTTLAVVDGAAPVTDSAFTRSRGKLIEFLEPKSPNAMKRAIAGVCRTACDTLALRLQ